MKEVTTNLESLQDYHRLLDPEAQKGHPLPVQKSSKGKRTDVDVHRTRHRCGYPYDRLVSYLKSTIALQTPSRRDSQSVAGY